VDDALIFMQYAVHAARTHSDVSSTRVGDAENGGTKKDDTRFSWTSLLRRVLDTEHSAYKVRQRTSVMLFMMASQSPSHKPTDCSFPSIITILQYSTKAS